MGTDCGAAAHNWWRGFTRFSSPTNTCATEHACLQMVRSCVVRRGKEREAAVALYMPGVREYVGGEFNEKELKDSIKRVGGTVNDSGLFLRPASSSIDVTSKTGLNRRSVVYIPRGKVPSDILKTLDQC